jgi:hypothetical protein
MSSQDPSDETKKVKRLNPSEAKASFDGMRQEYGRKTFLVLREPTLVTAATDDILSAVFEKLQKKRKDDQGDDSRPQKRCKTQAIRSMKHLPCKFNRQNLVQVSDERNCLSIYFGLDFVGHCAPYLSMGWYGKQAGAANGKKRNQVYFGDKTYGGSEIARFAAEKWRQSMSDALGKTDAAVAPFLRLQIEIPESAKIYCSWLLGGDGHFGVNICSVRVKLKQACFDGVPSVLLHLMQFVGGSISSSNTPNGKSWRRCYELTVESQEAVREVAKWVAQYGILKRDQAQAVVDYFEAKDLKDSTEDSTADLSDLKKILRTQHKTENTQKIEVEKYKDRLGPAALAGLFQAEGCVTLDHAGRGHSVRVRISQASCLPLLRQIVEHYGGRARVHKSEVVFKSSANRQFLTDIVPYLLDPKKEQVELAVRFLNMQVCGRTDRNRTEVVSDEISHIIQRMSDLKHRDHGYRF